MRLLSVEPTAADSEKKLVATFCKCKGPSRCKPEDRERIQFGSKGSMTYAEGASDAKQHAYLALHKPRESWDSINAGSLSRYILWSAKSISAGVANFRKHFPRN